MRHRMRTAIQYEFGGPRVLRVVEAERPSPGPGEVLVRVHAASVNFGETKVRSGPAQAGHPPFTLGSDLSGVVAGTGPGVTGFAPGDAVYGVYFIGTYAEYVAVPAVALAPRPAGLGHVEAAALPVAALTALRAVEQASLGAGDRILIHAAAGGVGHFAVQLAKLRGAYVLGTARAVKHDFLRSLGVDEPIDYTAVDFTEAARDVDVVLDLVGGTYGKRSLTALRPGGLLLGATLDPGVTEREAVELGHRYAWVSLRPTGEELRRITGLVEEGALRPHVERTFPLEQLVAAHEFADTGQITGKVVVVV
ncbi:MULTISPECIES: NADP-dependent oxidoreductase [unclassified Streptomyces]|uniref:NADP-dependent oxidoreductase n=1 Tax=unclassified Streptomyces TaxID=2593676 RepID=UPI0033C268E7